METIKPEKADTVNKVKAAGFNWVFTGLIGIVLWVVTDMHDDIKGILQALPKMQVQIDYLEDKRLIDRLKLHELSGKHEEHITYDSLTSK